MKKKVVNRRSIVFLSVFLSLVLLLQSVAMAVPIPPAEELTPSDMTFIETPFIEAEETAQRSKFEKHFRMSDGTYVAVAYADPVHEELPDGSWEEIDNTLSLVNGRYETDTETFKASFAANASGNNGLVALESEGYDLSWSVVILKNNPNLEVMATGGNNLQAVAPSLSAASVENPATTPFALMSESQKIESAVSASKVTYANAFGSGINLEYGIRAYAVKENVILQNADTGFRGYKMQVTALGLEAQKDEYNTITFADSEGNVKFTIEAPYMMDAEDNVSGDITVTLTQTANGYDITYIPNAQWLNTATYPVVIDPQANSSQSASNLLDTYTYEGDSTSNAVTRQNQDRMYVGNKSVSGTRKKHIGYFKFITLPTFSDIYAFQSASVILRCPSGTGTSEPFDLYTVSEDWATNTLTWDNKPATYKVCTAVNRNTSTNDTPFSGIGANRLLSNAVGNWYNGVQQNYGFMVSYTSASNSVADYNAFYTSNYSSSSVRPYLLVYYELMESAVSDGVYYIINAETGKYLTATNNGVSTANVVTQEHNGTPHQEWIVTKQENGCYKLSPAVNPEVRLLNDAGGLADGNNISVHSGYYGLSMEFSIIFNLDSNGYPISNEFRICTRSTGGSSCISDEDSNVEQKKRSTNDKHQVWIFENTTPTFSIPTIYSVDKGWNGRIPVTYYPTTATGQNIVWTSSEPLVATVTANGQVEALREGTTIIRAYKNNELIDSCSLSVKYALNSTDLLITDQRVKDKLIQVGRIADATEIAYLKGEISQAVYDEAINTYISECNVTRADYIGTGTNPLSEYAYAVLGGDSNSATPYPFSRVIRKGDTGFDVIVIQRALEVLGYYESDAASYGVFDDDTYEAACSYSYLMSADDLTDDLVFDQQSYLVLFQASNIDQRTYENYNALNKARVMHDAVAYWTAKKVQGTYKRTDNIINNGNAQGSNRGYADVLKDTGVQTFIWEVKPDNQFYYAENGPGDKQLKRYISAGNNAANSQGFTKPLIAGYDIGAFSIQWIDGSYIDVRSFQVFPPTDVRNGLVLYEKNNVPKYTVETVPVFVDVPEQQYELAYGYTVNLGLWGQVIVTGYVIYKGTVWVACLLTSGGTGYLPLRLLYA